MKFKKSKKEKINQPQNEEMICVDSPDKKEMVCSRGGEVVKVEAKEPLAESEAKRGGVWIGTMNFFAAPYRGLKENYEKKYGEAKKLFVIDLILLGIIAVLLGFNIYLFFGGVFGGKFPTINQSAPAKTTAISGSVESSLLSVKLKINGQDSTIFSPGEDLDYAISYVNSGGKDIYDVALKVDLEGAPLDFSRLTAGEGAVRGEAVVWTKDQIPDFAKLPPGAKGELTFRIGTMKAVDPPRALEFGSLLKSSFEISYKLENDFGQSYNFKSDVREDKFNSDLVLVSAARYYTEEGDQLGLGPLPPVVGKVTKYWIFLSVNNNLNDSTGVSVSAVLPPNVSWTGKISVSLGEINYDSTRRMVSWRVGDIGRYTGEILSKQGVAFEVALTPTVEEIGSEPTLLNQIKIFGKDQFTEQFLENREPDLTTNLIYDGLAAGKGRVVK